MISSKCFPITVRHKLTKLGGFALLSRTGDWKEERDLGLEEIELRSSFWREAAMVAGDLIFSIKITPEASSPEMQRERERER